VGCVGLGPTPSQLLGALVVEALVERDLLRDDVDRAIAIATEEIDVRKAMDDYEGITSLELAELIVDALPLARSECARAAAIARDEIDAHKAAGDY
jgi:hypothetical protein